MKNLFSLDNPLVQFLSQLCDLMIINILFLISCIPIFTVGAAICGMCKACQGIVMDDGRGIFNLYVSGFKSNFKQATKVWLVTLLIIASLVCYWLLAVNFCTGVLAYIIYAVMFLLGGISLCLLAYLFPLMVRYENSLREHLRNAGVLALTRLFLTAILLVLNVVPFVLPFISLTGYVKTLIVWVIIGFAFLCYMANLSIKPVFAQLEAKSTEDEEEE